MSVADTSWLARLDDKGTWAPLWLGLAVAVVYLLIRCAFDGLFLAVWGFPPGAYPLWRSVWWPEVVNAALLGYVPAALAVARRGINRDLSQLREKLPRGDADVDDVRAAASGRAGFGGQAFRLVSVLGSLHLVYMEPSLSLGADPSLTHPSFLWAFLRMPVFVWVAFTLIVSDFKATRTYLHMGRDLIEVDLLDVHSLTPFARRGLRSALTWVIYSIIFSLFWLGEGTASSTNPFLLVIVLTMATTAFIVPLLGVHGNIVSVKRLELDRLREEIRAERATVVDGLPDEKNPGSPRLANLIAYQQLIDRTREWPIDAANLLRFFIYLLIGLGSWLGGAVVELLLDRTLA